MVKLEAWFAYNENNDYVVSCDGEVEAREVLRGLHGGACAKVTKVTLTVTLPEVDEVEVTVPDVPVEKATAAAS